MIPFKLAALNKLTYLDNRKLAFYLSRPRIQGPLVIAPARQHNYGLEYCSLMVLPSLPPTIIMAETNGNLHHGILQSVEPLEEVTFSFKYCNQKFINIYL